MSRSLSIGILGTRGIPNRYGGFEQCAEYLALGLVAKGHEVWVYNAHNHEYKDAIWKGVRIIHCNDPEHKVGTAGQFIYDLNCLLDARKRKFDILLQLGYTSNSIWHMLWPKHSKNIVNMDGLEWKRSKYSKKVQSFLKVAEKWAANNADVLVADSIGIQQHLKETYQKESTFIPYGATVFNQPDDSVLASYALQPYDYHLLIARMEPENNIELIIKGVIAAKSAKKLMIIGNPTNSFGAYLQATYGHHEEIVFLGAIYDLRIINNLRHFSCLYFHGHSVGGTNPSLLEAMASSALIVAHNNVFNQSILGEDAYYFNTDREISQLLLTNIDKSENEEKLNNNLQKIDTRYSWNKIVDEYEAVFLQSLQ